MVLLYSLGAGLSSFSENFLKRWIGSCPVGHEKGGRDFFHSPFPYFAGTMVPLNFSSMNFFTASEWKISAIFLYSGLSLSFPGQPAP